MRTLGQLHYEPDQSPDVRSGTPSTEIRTGGTFGAMLNSNQVYEDVDHMGHCGLNWFRYRSPCTSANH